MDDLTELMRDAVERVDPPPRQRELWDGVGVATRRRHRNRMVGGLAAAAVLVGGGLVAAHQSSGSEPEPAGPPRAIDHGDTRATYGIYYPGDTPDGPRLYREFRAGPKSQKDLGDALRLLETTPADPDYTTYWTDGQLLGASVVNGVIQVEVDPSVAGPHANDRGGFPRSNALALQQVIYTVQGVVGERLPVQFVHDGNPVAEVDHEPTSEPLTNAPELDVLALASISDPSDRRVVEDGFSANGVASSFEGTVPWQLRAADGTVVRQGSAQSYGWVDRLYPWATGRIDVSDLAPGEYTFVVMTDDPSGGEGPGPTVDTRTVILQ
jgi:Immunoglobulin-like domain of bacterial spore germination/Sporulation and spore germination